MPSYTPNLSNTLHDFLLLDTNAKPMVEYDLQNFCDSVFQDLDLNPHLEADVTEICHYKEKENYEHEFLIVIISHSGKRYMLRLERTTSSRQSQTFVQKLTQISSSESPVHDMVRISLSLEPLTSDLRRGPFYPIATLRFSPQKLFALRELCVILSFFQTFSPVYKLRDEQCYWFCDVVMSTVHKACHGSQMVEAERFIKGGKFIFFNVRRSAETRQLFLDTYLTIRALGKGSRPVTLPIMTVARKCIHTLVPILAVPSSEVRTRAVIVLTSLASQSPECHQIVVEANAISKIIGIIPDASPRLKVYIFAAFDTLFIDRSLMRGLKTADIMSLSQFLTPYLSSNDEDGFRKAVLMLSMISSTKVDPFDTLSSCISLKLPPNSQLFILQVATSCVNGSQILITDKVFAELYRMISPAAPIRTRTEAVVALTHFVQRHPSIAMMSSDSRETRQFPKQVLKEIVKLLVEDNPIIRVAALQGLTALSNHTKFHAAIKDAITQLLHLLKDKDWDVQDACANTLIALVEYTELRPAIRSTISPLLQLLKNDDQDIRAAGSNITATITKHRDLRAAVAKGIPQLLYRVQDADLRAVIENAIPSLLQLLTDDRWHAKITGVDAMTGLAEYPECCVMIGNAIPQLLNLLNDNNVDVLINTVNAIAKLAKQIEYRVAIRKAIPQLLYLLKDHVEDVRVASINVVLNLAVHADFRIEIGVAIRQIVQLLDDKVDEIRTASMNVITKLVGNTELRAVIGTSIPRLFQLLRSPLEHFRVTSAQTITALAVHTELKAVIGNCIPQLFQMLQSHHEDYQVAWNAIVALAAHSELHAAIENGIRHLFPFKVKVIAGFQSFDPYAANATAKIMGKLAEYTELHAAIADGIPQLFLSLESHDRIVQVTSANTIMILAMHTDFHLAIANSIPQLLHLLENYDQHVRITSADTIVKLAAYPKLRGVITNAIPHLLQLLPYDEGNISTTIVKLTKHGDFLTALMNNPEFLPESII